ncbi:MAG: glycosyltransferase family 39 protein [Fibromonadaceae bacterium]|nr:glycosyltransferase family 39 protein [Fibromonadaceae bacterium]
MKKILREPLLYLLPLFAVLYVIIIPGRIEILDTKLINNNKTENIKLPHSSNVGEHKSFLITFNLQVKDKKNAKFQMIPDDCIREILINGEEFPMSTAQKACDYVKGAYFDFSEHVQEGLNNFELRMHNFGGPGGLRVETPYNGLRSLSLMHYIFTLFLLLSTALILRKFKFKFFAISIILLGIVVRLILYTYTGPMQYSYDTDGHLQYIQIISEEKRLPKFGECWSCHHPPLYYIGSAVVKNAIDSYDSNLTARVLQQSSLLFSFASIAFGVALILNLFGNRRYTYLASLIFVFWPGFVLAAPRIGNDILFYFGALFCMLFALRYWRFHKSSDMLLASIGAAIAVAAKSTGIVILGTWVIIYILSVVSSLKIGSLRTLFISAFIIALFVGFSNYRIAVNIFEGKKAVLMESTSSLNSNLKVNNTVGNYLYFDLQDYLLVPYASAWNDKGGRQYFWNYALKTSLFGEFKFWSSPVGHIFAASLSALALFIFLLALWGIIHVKFKEIPPLLFAVFLFAALIYLRISYPYSCSNDFRYIFPTLLPIAYFSVRGIQVIQNLRLKVLSYTALLIFASLSFLFIVAQAF